MNGLPLQALLMLWIIFSANGAPYSKYGRTCKDIGCLPREVCVMAYESCSFNQQENVSCGRYPTCKKNTDQQGTQQNSGSLYPSLTTSPSTSIWNVPSTVKYTQPRTTTTTTTTRRPWTTQAPFYNPSNPSYNGGGSYYGNRYGDDSDFGGSPFVRPTTKYTTKRPSSSSSSGGGLFSGFGDILQRELGNFIGQALSNRGGSSSGGSSFGSLFGGGGGDTRPISQSRGSFGLFNENPSTGTTGSGSTGDYSKYPVTRYGDASHSSSYPTSAPSASHGSYGWRT